MSAKAAIQEIASNPKIGQVVASSTIGTGIGTILELIPDDIGKLATVVGIILSSVLIYTHWRKGRIEYKKTQLEIKILMDREVIYFQIHIRKNLFLVRYFLDVCICSAPALFKRDE